MGGAHHPSLDHTGTARMCSRFPAGAAHSARGGGEPAARCCGPRALHRIRRESLSESTPPSSGFRGMVRPTEMMLKYGANPHQRYASVEPVKAGTSPIEVVNGTPSLI